MNLQECFDKISILLDPTEIIEYALIEKNKDHDCIVLTNKKMIKTDLDLYNKNVFNFFDIKNNTNQNIEQIKKMLQSNDFEINTIISKYFNVKTDVREAVSKLI